MKEKPKCQCGQPILCKGLCRRCYQRNYAVENYNVTPQWKFDVNEMFETVLAEVQEGYGIRKAIENQGVSHSNVYRKLSQEQKDLLKQAKMNCKLKIK